MEKELVQSSMSGTAFLPFYLILLLHVLPKVFIHQHSGHKVMFGPFNQLVFLLALGREVKYA